MWGYIVFSRMCREHLLVPSLYVRVYRLKSLSVPADYRSLIICEGISDYGTMKGEEPKFPHYMWGYIGHKAIGQNKALVPSLYVRVYRINRIPGTTGRGSLIICEGISRRFIQWALRGLFPHYMWGYIIGGGSLTTAAGVPSLYVRVYQTRPHST